ncbi:MAG: hypothetical protein M3N93_08300, partial [Acidobacteriota bacterium]|nr:hypothetical protein [Acidobacteriota bacterium]
PGILLLLQSWRSRLILEQDVIEVHSGFRAHRVTREEIEGLRTIENQYGRWTRVYLKHDRGAFNVSASFTGGDDLERWFKGIPDLDQRDADAIKKEVSGGYSPATPDTNNSNTFDWAENWAIGFSVLAGAVSIPVIWVSDAFIYRTALCLLLACPPVAIILLHRFPLLFTAFRRKPDPRGDLGFLIVWPGAGVMYSFLTANDPSHLVDSLQLAYWVLLILAGFVGALFQTVWRSPSRGAVFFFIVLCGGMYSIGLVNAINTLPDRSLPRPYRTRISKMHEIHSSKGTRYYLLVAPWGPMIYPDNINVPMRTYNTSRVGDSVCFGLHPGFLRAPWYALMPCTPEQGPTAP